MGILASNHRTRVNIPWITREGQEQGIGLDCILIIAPYTAQVFEIQDAVRVRGLRLLISSQAKA
jgi:hypothetical protein